MTTTQQTKKSILVTGGNTGIGFALCKQLVLEDHCKVYLGARNIERGTKAVQDIQALIVKGTGDVTPEDIEFLLIDVSDDTSVAQAADTLRTKFRPEGGNQTKRPGGRFLYGLVNNAGIGLKTGSGCEDELLATNFYGPKRVLDQFVGLLNNPEGESRVVNVSSGAASMYLRDQSSEVKQFFTNPNTTWDELVTEVEKRKTLGDGQGGGRMGVYGLSKAALNLLTIQQGQQNQDCKMLCSSISPGFIATNLTKGWNAPLTPEQGTVSIRKCLLSPEIQVSGYYYGSDGLRSPLTMTRDPGTPEYEGEEEMTIDRSKYNK